MSVAEAAWGLTLIVFSIKSDVTNDESLKRRKIQEVHKKSFKGPTRKFSRIAVVHHAPEQRR